MLALFVASFLLVLLPGAAVVCLLSLRQKVLRVDPLLVIVASSAVLGYLTFYLILLVGRDGRYLLVGLTLASLFVVGSAVQRQRASGLTRRDVWEPIAIAAVAGLCYLSFLFLFADPLATGVGYVGGRFFNRELAGDNLVPMILGQRLYDGKPLHPFCCGGWTSADRPPLQAGMFLMVRGLSITSRIGLLYQVLATGLQCFWICGVWSLLRSIRWQRSRIRLVLLPIVFSGVLFFESVFTWPKLLTATFLLFAIGVVAKALVAERVLHAYEAWWAGLCLGLALMSHTGAALSLVAVPIVWFRYRKLLPLKRLLPIAAAVVCFLAPWWAYQRYVDPPGNHLLKLHLAGEVQFTDRSAVAAIEKAYAGRSFAEIVGLRWSNVRILPGEGFLQVMGLPEALSAGAGELGRGRQERLIGNALGVLNWGWVAILVFVVRKRRTDGTKLASFVLPLLAINLMVWCLVEFGPEFTILGDASFGDFLLSSVVLAAVLVDAGSIVLGLVTALQVWNLVVVWVWSPPFGFAGRVGDNAYAVSLNIPLLVTGTISAILLGLHLTGVTARMMRVLAAELPDQGSVYDRG